MTYIRRYFPVPGRNTMRRSRTALALVLLLAVVGLGATRALAQTPKPGGHLNVMLREDLLAGVRRPRDGDHLACVSVVAVLQQPGDLRPRQPAVESPDSVVRRAGRAVVLAGQLPQPGVLPAARTSSGTTASPSPRRTSSSPSTWCARRPDATAQAPPQPAQGLVRQRGGHRGADPYTVVFRLKRPQPSLLMMLASGYSPIYAAHVNPADYRNAASAPGPSRSRSGARASSSST